MKITRETINELSCDEWNAEILSYFPEAEYSKWFFHIECIRSWTREKSCRRTAKEHQSSRREDSSGDKLSGEKRFTRAKCENNVRQRIFHIWSKKSILIEMNDEIRLKFSSAFSSLQSSSWILTLGSLNRYFLIHKSSLLDKILKRQKTLINCLALSLIIFFGNAHLLVLNGFRNERGKIICYKNDRFENYFLWYQRVHLFFYSLLPSAILLVFNGLLIRTIFQSKKRLKSHQRNSAQFVESSKRRKRTSIRHNRKLTLSLIFLTLSYFVLTFPSTVIFSFIRSWIQPAQVRRTVSLFFTNLSTTTHAIRFFIYFFCSMDFRDDFYSLFRRRNAMYRNQSRKCRQEQQTPLSERHFDSIFSRENCLTSRWRKSSIDVNRKKIDLCFRISRSTLFLFFSERFPMIWRSHHQHRKIFRRWDSNRRTCRVKRFYRFFSFLCFFIEQINK